MFNWKLKDVIMVCLFSVIFLFIYLGAVYLANFIATILAPLGLAPFAYEILFGVWFMAATFVPYIVQRSGVAIIAEVLSAVIEVIMGNMFGPIVILSGIIQGAGPEIIFAKDRYKNYTMKNMCLAAFAACVTSFIWGFVRGGFVKYSATMLVGMFVVRAISSIIFAGVICKIAADKLAKTGALSSYTLGNQNSMED